MINSFLSFLFTAPDHCGTVSNAVAPPGYFSGQVSRKVKCSLCLAQGDPPLTGSVPYLLLKSEGPQYISHLLFELLTSWFGLVLRENN